MTTHSPDTHNLLEAWPTWRMADARRAYWCDVLVGCKMQDTHGIRVRLIPGTHSYGIFAEKRDDNGDAR